MPVTFITIHYVFWLSQEYLLPARSARRGAGPKAPAGTVVFAADVEVPISNEGRTCSQFPHQSRSDSWPAFFSTRFLGKKESTLGRERELLIVVCKNGNVAEYRGLEQCVRRPNRPALDIFPANRTPPAPYLGGNPELFGQNAPVHRRSLNAHACLIITTPNPVDFVCMDPGDIDLLNDFAA